MSDASDSGLRNGDVNKNLTPAKSGQIYIYFVPQYAQMLESSDRKQGEKIPRALPENPKVENPRERATLHLRGNSRVKERDTNVRIFYIKSLLILSRTKTGVKSSAIPLRYIATRSGLLASISADLDVIFDIDVTTFFLLSPARATTRSATRN